ncbi:oligosaccharide flippase family protein [bacterium]|nr:oligosaccharide flippase family protein [bacterium]
MGIIQRQGFKGMIGTYVGFVLGYVNLLILYPYFLSSEEIGVMRVFIDLGLVLGTLSMLGSNTSMFRFAPVFREKDSEKLSGLFSFFFIEGAIGVAIVCTLFYFNKSTFQWLFAKNMEEILPYFLWIIPLIALNTVNNLLESISSIRGRITIPVFVREVVLRLGYASIVLLYAKGVLDFESMIKCIPIIVAVQCFILLFYVKQLNISFSLKFRFFLQDPELRREFLVYSGYLLLSVLAGMFINKIDYFMLGAMKGASVTGVYTIASSIGIVVSIPKRNLKQIAQPIVAELTRKNDKAGLSLMYKDASINMIMLAMLIFQVIWFNIDGIFELMPNGDNFKEGKWVVFIIGSAFIIQVSAGIGNMIMSYSNYYFHSLWYSVLSIIVAVVTNLLLIPKYGGEGAAVGTLITNIVLTGTIVIINYIKGNVYPFDKRALLALTLFLALIAVNSLFTIDSYVVILNGLKSIIFVLIFIIVGYRLNLSSQLSKILEMVLERVGLKSWIKD